MPPDPNPLLGAIGGVIDVRRVVREDERLGIGGLLGEPRPAIPLGPRLFRGPDDPAASIVFSDGADGDLILQTGSGQAMRRIPAWTVWLRLGLLLLFLIMLAVSLLFALIWLPRLLLGRLRDAGPLSLRALPAAAAAAFVGLVAVVLLAADSAYGMINRLGQPTPWSVAVFALSILFAACAVGGAVQAVRSLRWAAPGRGVRIYAALASGINLAAAIYLAAWGVIGVMTWR